MEGYTYRENLTCVENSNCFFVGGRWILQALGDSTIVGFSSMPLLIRVGWISEWERIKRAVMTAMALMLCIDVDDDCKSIH